MTLIPLLGAVSLLLAVTVVRSTAEKRAHSHDDPSDHPHDDAQGFQFDHEAFLGKMEAKTFDELTPEESKEKLGKIVERMDTDGDGQVSHAELHQWIKLRQDRYIQDDVNRQWAEFDLNKDELVSWGEYHNKTYGYFLDHKFGGGDEKSSYHSMVSRDERRFKTADRNGDGMATKEEMTAFLHPEQRDYMKDVVVKETIEDMDLDGDGLITLEEYIGDMMHEEGETEAEWITTEKAQFVEVRDLNKDGTLDASEVANWILPREMDHADNEARHLIQQTDQDKNAKLTKEEILANWNMFVGSQATNYGEDLTRRHDEL